MTTLQFLGAAGTVTGSKFLVDNGDTRFMVDCGMFQGAKKLRLLNWDPCPVRPSSVDHVILTHAHIDHVGMLPRLVREGFQGPVWCTPATRDLTKITLIDAGHLQEEDARFASKIPVRAQVRSLESLSAHADANEILFWLKSFQAPPRRTFIVHGEPKASAALAERIGSTFRWTSHIPEYLETVELV
jgi:metallo-beta-lactamase family protein